MCLTAGTNVLAGLARLAPHGTEIGSDGAGRALLAGRRTLYTRGATAFTFLVFDEHQLSEQSRNDWLYLTGDRTRLIDVTPSRTENTGRQA